ncbi:MAG: hypothetical protein QM706_07930 [Nitrospira sp.]
MAKIDPVEIQQIEQIVDKTTFQSAVEGILQRLETHRAIRFHHHDFSIQPGLFHRQLSRGSGLLPELDGPFMTIS